TGRRSEVFLATKFGAFDPAGPPQDGPTSKPSHIIKSVNLSLEKLQTNYIDLYYQHRVDTKVPIEVVMETLRPFIEQGRIKYLGLSECSIDTLRRAKAVEGVGEKLIAIQMEYSPFTLDIEQNGLAAAAEELGVSVIAYSPLARGLVTGRVISSFRSRDDFEPNDLRSRSIERVEENGHSAELALPLQAIQTIRTLVNNAKVAGTRNRTVAWIAAGVEGNCIKLEEWKGEENM
ncbi:hypothetical protein MPER_05147, partial [Moniliophthora perniciosa FA553]